MTFAGDLSSVRVLDAACGSGNFLYVALKQLLDLEKQVINLGADLGLTRMLPSVGPEQLYGIEINELAHELAQVTVWIGYIQWHKDNGFAELKEPILQPLDSIKHMDAILAFDEAGKPVKPKWPEVEVIIGNPPFLGDRKMRRELGDSYVDTLRKLYNEQLPPSADLVCYWFERSREMIEHEQVGRVGLLATNSIRGGSNRKVLDHIKETGDIFVAWSDRPWILDGAAVRVSIIGFDDGGEKQRELDGQIVPVITSALKSGVDLSFARRLAENQRISFIGTQKSGPFDLTDEQAKGMLLDQRNTDGRKNDDVVKPWINALDITQRPRNMWIIDFGVATPLQEAALYKKPFEYVEANVKPVRDIVRRKSHRDKWWLFGDTRPGMRKALALLERYIVTPLVSKHRVFVWKRAPVIPENLLVVIARADDYFIGVLQSSLHEVWALRMGTWLGVGNDPRYTPSTTFETFPFPWPPGKEPQDDSRVTAIADAARMLVEQRDAWLNEPGLSEGELKKRTLTNLYNQRPPWLDQAHKELDEAVFDAYGWPQDLSDEEILSRLLALNLERAAKQGETPTSVVDSNASDDEE